MSNIFDADLAILARDAILKEGESSDCTQDALVWGDSSTANSFARRTARDIQKIL